MNTDTIHQQMHKAIKNKRVLEQAKGYAYEYLDSLPLRPVFPDRNAIDGLAEFDESLPESSQSPDEILEQLNTFGSPATVAQMGGRYFGFVNGSCIPVGLAARWLSDTWDQNAALYVISPIASKLEQICERWLTELLHLPDKSALGLVGGTSTATLCGLAAARYSLLNRLGWDINSSGLNGAPALRIIVSQQSHGSVIKALALLGFGKEQLEIVPADAQARTDLSTAAPVDERTLLILQAGNVNTGAFDSFDRICAQAAEAGAWVHVDGAFGLWAAASRSKAHLTRGMEKADSWSVDGHKTLNTPYDCGIVLCRHRDALVSAMQATGEYMQFSEARDGMLFSPDMSRRARSIELWATLKFLGGTGVEQLVDAQCARAQQFAELLRQNDFTILNDVVFNQVLLACDTAHETKSTLEGVQRSGSLWCGGTSWNGQPAIRISVCSWATTEKDVEDCVDVFVACRRAARRVESDQPVNV